MRNPDGYRRCLLKISGEALGGKRGFGLEPEAMHETALEIAHAFRQNRQIGIVVGGGNFLRGSDSGSIGVPSIVGDHMGMIATVMNGIALRWALHAEKVPAIVMGAFPVSTFIEPFHPEKARDYLSSNQVVVFVGGTGNPCFTTDSASALRTLEIEADVMIKATQADGVYNKDPKKYADAVKFDTITHEQVLQKRLGVMDASAVEILGRRNVPTIVLDLHKQGNIAAALAGESIGTLITDK